MRLEKQRVQPAVHAPLTENNINGNPDYAPDALVDALLQRLALKNDAALARVLQLAPAVISKMRNKKAEITPSILVRMYDATGININDLRTLMGVKPSFSH